MVSGARKSPFLHASEVWAGRRPQRTEKRWCWKAPQKRGVRETLVPAVSRYDGMVVRSLPVSDTVPPAAR
ncbi:hypothetical protein GCM10010360_44210 [Streptomyces nogalater]